MKYVVMNFKNLGSYQQMKVYSKLLNKSKINVKNLVVMPSNIHLSLFEADNYYLGVQDFTTNKQVITGEVLAEQLTELNVEYTFIGHFERRHHLHENRDIIVDKIRNAIDNKFKVILGIGEFLKSDNSLKVVEEQISEVFNSLSKSEMKHVVIAYEPGYLIGSSDKIDIVKIQEMINFIKSLVMNYYEVEISVIYGGSVVDSDILVLSKLDNLDGLVLSKILLEEDTFVKVLDELTNV